MREHKTDKSVDVDGLLCVNIRRDKSVDVDGSCA